MKNEIFVQIPTPCHEDWGKMTPTQQGRHCASCCKEVIDFSMMSDVEILKLLNKPNGNTCGRFHNDQLLRPLQDTKIEKKKGWQWMMASITSLFVLSKASAQTMGKMKAPNKAVVTTHTRTITSDMGTPTIISNERHITGYSIFIENARQCNIKGQVTDDKGNALEGATVTILKKHYATVTKNDGSFLLKETKNADSIEINFSYVGYQSKTVTLVLDNNELEMHVQLKQAASDLQGVVVIGYKPTSKGEVIAGGYSRVSCKKVSKIDTIKTAVQKVFNAEIFKVYPNPATKGSVINIVANEVGAYSFQLLNNQSQILHIEEIIVADKKQIFQIQLPSTASSGMYYVRLIDKKTKKQYVDEIVVQ
jgi:hypothetical protein